MTNPIALVTRGDAATQEEWRAALAAAMPEETILPFQALNAEQRRQADIAIVANPDPANVAALPNLAWVQSLWAGVERLVGELGADAPPIVRLVDPELSRAMAEAVLAWTLYLQRDMPAYARQQRQRVWQALTLLPRTCAGPASRWRAGAGPGSRCPASRPRPAPTGCPVS